MTTENHIIAASTAHMVEKRLTVAHWMNGEDAEYHTKEALRYFEELARLLGYRVEKVEPASAPDYRGEPPALRSAIVVGLQAAE